MPNGNWKEKYQEILKAHGLTDNPDRRAGFVLGWNGGIDYAADHMQKAAERIFLDSLEGIARA